MTTRQPKVIAATNTKLNKGFSARLMVGNGPNTIPRSGGPSRPTHHLASPEQPQEPPQPNSKVISPRPVPHSPPSSKTTTCKDTRSLWKSVQDCHASLFVSNPRHFEFAVANLCFLLKTYGKELDLFVKGDIDNIFKTLRIIVVDPNKRLTMRTQALKMIELRARCWDSKQETPRTIPVAAKATPEATPHTPEAPSVPTEIIAAAKYNCGPNSAGDSTPKWTRFWDSLVATPEFSPKLPPVQEESPSPNRTPEQIVSSPHVWRENLELTSPETVPNETGDHRFERQDCTATTPQSNAANSSTESLRRLSVNSQSNGYPPIQYSREFLLRCWDSPSCRVMPAALQHTIPHSDIYYIVRIPTFEDPTFLLKDSSPPDVASLDLRTQQRPYMTSHHHSCPANTELDV